MTEPTPTTSADPIPAPPLRTVRRVERRRDERGVVLVWLALCLVVMLMFAGFMVDLGAWYQQSQDIQRTADAAALAGATYLPDNPSPSQAGGNIPTNCGTTVAAIEAATPTNAYCAALKSVYKNGYTNATVLANVDGTNNRQLDVSVQQAGIAQYFTSFFMGPLTFTRYSHAQFSQPIDLGSPQNYFGTGTLEGYSGFRGAGNSTNFWAAIAGYCEAKEGGDEYASGYDGNVANSTTGTYTSASNCDPTSDNRISNPGASCSASASPPQNCEFDPLGYEYTIAVPSSATSNGHLWIFNAAYDPCLSPPIYDNTGKLIQPPPNPALPPLIDTDSNLALNYPCGSGGPPNNYTKIRTYYTLSGPGGYIATYRASQTPTTGGGYPGWTELTAQNGFSTLKPGNTYFLNVATITVTNNGNTLASSPTTSDGSRSWGIHNYGLMVTTLGSTPSSSLNDGSTYSCIGANCPSIYANTSTAEAATIVSPVCSGSCSGSAATAYLANVPAAAVGKTVTLKVWDPGDYAQYMQVIQPDGTPLPSFSYNVFGADPSSAASYGGTIPSPNNSTDPGGTVSSCTDPLTGSAMVDPTTGTTVSTPCLPVDGCIQNPTSTAPPVYACNTGNIGTNAWGAPHNRFGMAPYNDALVQISFVATQTGWYGLKEVTNQAQVHDTITVNLVIDGLPPHLTP